MRRRGAFSPGLLAQLGVTRLRPGQRQVIDAVLAGEDVLAILPTGGGKSLCYQVPALELEGTTLVVSPLISLMKDQADKLDERGVEAAALNSTLTGTEERGALKDVRTGRAEIVFTTPERLADAGFLRSLARQKIDLLVVDEAHCISQWGHDFRPAFLGIRDAARALGDPPILGLTATAPPRVVEDIKQGLGRPRMRVVDAGIYRANLVFRVRQATSGEEKFAALREALRRQRGCAIVYVATVKVAEEVHRRLVAAGEDARLYHGRLPSGERTEAQEAFMRGDARVMVATNAFGMGIDKPDIRLVVHYQVPGSLEAYYQEAGRAGRDGADALCLLLYEHADRRVQLFFAGGKNRDKSTEDRARVERMTFYAQSTLCRWQVLLEYFGDPVGEPCGRCDNCVRPKAPEGREMRLDPEKPALQRGDAVTVPRYGDGVVESLGADRVAVSFPNGTTREFAPRYVERARR